MKVKDLYFIIGLTTLFLLSAAFVINRAKGTDPVVTETRMLPNYDKINVQTSLKVFLYQGEEHKVVIEAQQEIVDNIETIVKDNELIVRMDPTNHGPDWIKQKGVTVRLYLPIINGIKVLGSSDIQSKTPFSSDLICINVVGSGNVKLGSLTANSVSVDIAGSGNVILTGTCDEQDLVIRGSGDIENFDLICNSSKVKVHGSGSVNVMCIDYLKARIIGSGDIYYKGDPITECSIAGLGKLHSI